MNIVDLIIVGIFNLVIFLIKLLLYPIDLLVATFLPELSNAFSDISAFLEQIFQYMGWAIAATGIPYAALSMIATYWIFKLTLPLNVWFVKLGVKWFRALKP